MNTEYVLFNLKEAAEELAKAIDAVQADNENEFEAWLIFTYRKLNRAWNSRHMTPQEVEGESSEEFEINCRFPADLSAFVADH